MRRTWLVGVAALAVVAAACTGGASPSPTQPPITAPSPSPAPTLPPAGTILTSGSVEADEIPLSAEQEALIKATSNGKLVGIVATTLDTEYHKNLNDSAKARAEELGYTAEICDSQVDPAKALACLEGFVSKGATAIITTSDAETVGSAVKAATDQGIVVVQVTGTSLIDSGAITVSVDNITIGEAEGTGAGDYAAKTWPGETVEAIILDYPEIAALVDRADAIERNMLAADPNIKVVERLIGGLPENGVTSCETALQKYPNLRLVGGINDGGNLGCLQALKAAGRGPDQTVIFGIDCDPAAVAEIQSGTSNYKGCVDTNPTGTGEIAVNVFNRLLTGEDVPALVEVPVSVYSGG
jgi:ABC-type sugar transport system substrate-binding protein